VEGEDRSGCSLVLDLSAGGLHKFTYVVHISRDRLESRLCVSATSCCTASEDYAKIFMMLINSKNVMVAVIGGLEGLDSSRVGFETTK
jgi:hypothetical protein